MSVFRLNKIINADFLFLKKQLSNVSEVKILNSHNKKVIAERTQFSKYIVSPKFKLSEKKEEETILDIYVPMGKVVVFFVFNVLILAAMLIIFISNKSFVSLMLCLVIPLVYNGFAIFVFKKEATKILELIGSFPSPGRDANSTPSP